MPGGVAIRPWTCRSVAREPGLALRARDATTQAIAAATAPADSTM